MTGAPEQAARILREQGAHTVAFFGKHTPATSRGATPPRRATSRHRLTIMPPGLCGG